ncbi:MBL fold metallo-hydrolase [Williamsia sp. 1135]|uniref:MBL fold metallo-hydrolase n=1 Tax=Williamsia sp. 1135 TaxID=1889262 RepID=UPI000A0FB439|nr:MBL fold metallo-hydrolase [Williamsia sp. 1135]ORM24133.1 hydrolase [Williamsia sp. 1135]
MDSAVVICRTCAVEHAGPLPVQCRICSDERQYLPPDGQMWASLDQLASEGQTVVVDELEPGLLELYASPGVGINQRSKLVCTEAGNLLWDPIGLIDEAAIADIRRQGEVVAIAASHPHMFGVQVEWSHALGRVPVLVAEADMTWVARPDPVIEPWAGDLAVLPEVTLTQPGGHFPGSAVAHWSAGAEGRGVLLAGDTVLPNPDRASVSFMRSYPNRIPLSAAVVERVAAHLERFDFDRLYGNFADYLDADAKGIVRRSADRHKGWVQGDFDHLT